MRCARASIARSGGLWGASTGLLLAALADPRRLGQPLLVVTGNDDDMLCGIEALLQPVRPRRASAAQLELRVGQTLDRAQVLQRRRPPACARCRWCSRPASAACAATSSTCSRWPPTRGAPRVVRPDELESIRTFDPSSQRTTAVHDDYVAGARQREPATGEAGRGVLEAPDAVATLVLAYEPLRIDERAGRLLAFDSERRHACQRAAGHAAAVLARLDDVVAAEPRPRLQGAVGRQRRSAAARPTRSAACAACAACRAACCCSAAARTNASACARSSRTRASTCASSRSTCCSARSAAASASPSCRRPRCRTSSSPACRSRRACANARAVPSRAIQSFFELGPGDLVVHAVHGIARFEGTELVHRGQGTEEHLRLCFQDDVKLLVPASKIHLVQKYVGSGGGARPPLDKLGGKGFQRRKEQVQEALFDLAAELLEVQSKRALVQRPPYPPSRWSATSSTRSRSATRPTRRAPGARSSRTSRKPADGPPAVRRRRLRQDRGGAARRVPRRHPTAARSPCWRRRRSSPSSTRAPSAKRCEPFGLRVEMLSRYRTGKRTARDRRDSCRRAPSTSSSARTSCSARTSQFPTSASSSSTRSSASACGRRSGSSSCAPRSTC
jgi:hypothetical protein